jgi:hypothetical protein
MHVMNNASHHRGRTTCQTYGIQVFGDVSTKAVGAHVPNSSHSSGSESVRGEGSKLI